MNGYFSLLISERSLFPVSMVTRRLEIAKTSETLEMKVRGKKRQMLQAACMTVGKVFEIWEDFISLLEIIQ